MLNEINELGKVRKVYSGIDNKVVDATFFLKLLSFDGPERYCNSNLNDSGTYTKRFGYSADVSKEEATMCWRCEKQTTQNH